MVGYNVVAILLFLLLNSPPLYSRIKTAQNASWAILRRVVGKPRDTRGEPHTTSHEEQFSPRRSFCASDLPLLILGHMTITTAAPLITAVLVTRQYASTAGPSIWGQMSHWATRPRTTGPLIFLYLCLQTYHHPDLEQQQHETAEQFAARKRAYDASHPGMRKMSPYGTAVLVSCFGDQIVSALGLDNVNLMIAYARAEYADVEGTGLVRSLEMLRVAIVFGLVANLGIVWFLGRDVQLCLLEWRRGVPRGTLTTRKAEIWILGLTMCVLAVHLLLAFMGGWAVWKAFLELETKQNYCVQNLWQVDLVYYLLPVALNLWRIMAKKVSASKRTEGVERC